MRTRTGVAAAVCGALGVTTIASAAGRVADHYYLTDLGTLGLTNSVNEPSGWGINDLGQVVGSGLGGGTSGPPFVWRPTSPNAVDGAMMQLPFLSVRQPSGPFGGAGTYTYTTGIAWGINNVGQIGGFVGDEVRGVLWTPTTSDGASYTVTDLNGGASTITVPAAYRINASGQLASRQSGHATVWTPTTPNGSTGTQTIVSSTSTAAYAIDDRGDVAGNGFIFRPSDPNGATGTTTPLNYVVWDLSPDGTYAATNVGTAVGGNGFVLNIDPNTGQPTGAGHFVSTKRVLGVNNAGVAVTDAGEAWSAADGTVDLNTRLETHSGLNWTITNARDINASGQIVARASNNASQTIRAVLLTPLIDGDATIDQHVDFADLLTLARHYGNASAATWRDGDFNGDGSVNFTDLLTLARNYGSTTSATDLATQTDDTFAADWALAQSLVPEPAIAAVSILATTLLRRRRR